MNVQPAAESPTGIDAYVSGQRVQKQMMAQLINSLPPPTPPQSAGRGQDQVQISQEAYAKLASEGG